MNCRTILLNLARISVIPSLAYCMMSRVSGWFPGSRIGFSQRVEWFWHRQCFSIVNIRMYNHCWSLSPQLVHGEFESRRSSHWKISGLISANSGSTNLNAHSAESFLLYSSQRASTLNDATDPRKSYLWISITMNVSKATWVWDCQA